MSAKPDFHTPNPSFRLDMKPPIAPVIQSRSAPKIIQIEKTTQTQEDHVLNELEEEIAQLRQQLVEIDMKNDKLTQKKNDLKQKVETLEAER